MLLHTMSLRGKVALEIFRLLKIVRLPVLDFLSPINALQAVVLEAIETSGRGGLGKHS